MTTSQRITLMAKLWPAACQAQNWREDDRELRLEVCSIALNFEIKGIQDFGNLYYSNAPMKRVLKSTNEIDHDRDFTRVKALLLMLANKLEGAREIDHPEINKRRQKIQVIREQLRCMAVYPLEKPMGMEGAERYVAELIRDKFKGGSRAMPLAIEDLSGDPTPLPTGREIPSQIDQLLFRLRRLLHGRKTGLRVQAGDSMHDMRLRVGLPCYCAMCCKLRAGTLYRSIRPAAEETEKEIAYEE